jgi:transcriptional regulator with XRE-family HTH domain
MTPMILKKLRKAKGYSQEELAKEAGISRQTLISYEKGSHVSVENAKKLGAFFDVDYTCFIDNKEPKAFGYNVLKNQSTIVEEQSMRIDIPQENIQKFKEVFLYIIEKVGAKPNVGRTVLFKLLYFIDFDYYELFEEQLIGAIYIKNKFGPTPLDFSKIIDDMSAAGDVEIINSKYFTKDQTKYLPRRNANLNGLSAQEIKHINGVLHKLSDKTASQLSNLSHRDVPWIGTEEREIIPYDQFFTELRKRRHEVMIYKENLKFQKDMKRLCKKFSSLKDDLENLKKYNIDLFHAKNINNGSIIQIEGMCNDMLISYKVKKIACRSLKKRGRNRGLRLTYAYKRINPRKCLFRNML